MQMGRWFGFRSGYKDLVRLYIGRNEPDGSRRIDLYEAFESMVQDEEAFREELARYAVPVDGKPQITPRDIPPLVSQRLPWLRPAAPNKMYNAELVIRRSPGVLVEPRAYPEDSVDTAHNYGLLAPLAARAERLLTLRGGLRTRFDAYTGLILHGELVQALADLRWISTDYFRSDLRFLQELGHDLVRDWLLVLPQRSDYEQTARLLPEIGYRSIFERSRRTGGSFAPITESRHRVPAQYVAGVIDSMPIDDPAIEEYTHAHRGAVLLHPVVDKNRPAIAADPIGSDNVTLAFGLYSPINACHSGSPLVQFRVRNSQRERDAIVPMNLD
jgi:hypothetical protein